MTEDILFDNILIGHDEAEAKKFAKETFHVKKPIEQEAEGSAPDEDDEEAETLVDKIRLRVYEFIRQCIGVTLNRRADRQIWPDLTSLTLSRRCLMSPLDWPLLLSRYWGCCSLFSGSSAPSQPRSRRLPSRRSQPRLRLSSRLRQLVRRRRRLWRTPASSFLRSEPRAWRRTRRIACKGRTEDDVSRQQQCAAGKDMQECRQKL